MLLKPTAAPPPPPLQLMLQQKDGFFNLLVIYIYPIDQLEILFVQPFVLVPFLVISSCMQLRNKNVSGAMCELRVQRCHFH